MDAAVSTPQSCTPTVVARCRWVGHAILLPRFARRKWLPSGVLSDERALEPLGALFVRDHTIADALAHDGAAPLAALVHAAKAALPPSVRLLLLSVGVGAEVARRQRLAAGAAASSSAHGVLMPGTPLAHEISPARLRDVLADLLVWEDVDSLLVDTPSQLGAELVGLTRAAAEAPAKQRSTALAAGHKVRVPPLASVLAGMGVDPSSLPAMPACGSGELVRMQAPAAAVADGGDGEDDNDEGDDDDDDGGGGGLAGGSRVTAASSAGRGRGARGSGRGRGRVRGRGRAGGGPARDRDVREVFYSMLQTVPLVSAKRAAGIVQQFPTLASLADAYEADPAGAPTMNLDASGSAGVAVSRRVHALLTSDDPGRLIE